MGSRRAALELKERAVKLRAAGATDAAVVAGLLGVLGYPISTEEAKARLARDADQVVLADSEGEVLGLLALSVQPQITHPRPVARVTALVVRESARRRGVGRLLMDRAAELARAHGCDGIELTSAIAPERGDSHRFYEALGYQRMSYRFWRRLESQAGGK